MTTMAPQTVDTPIFDPPTTPGAASGRCRRVLSVEEVRSTLRRAFAAASIGALAGLAGARLAPARRQS